MDCLRDTFTDGVLLNGRYRTVSPLNHGSFGMVFMAEDLLLRRQVALKCLTKAASPSVAAAGLLVDDRSEELAIHTRIGRHPHIVNLLDSFETETHAFLVLEFCSQGDLYEAIRYGRGPRETEHVRDFMLQLVEAVEHLHRKGIYHRDIKPENIFLTARGNMKLGDFGLATADAWSHEVAVGSDRYMAPEQFDHQGAGLSPARAHVWSVGICLLNILFSRNPFAEPAPSDLIFADFARDRQSLFDVFPNMSVDTYRVLDHCLTLDPEKRSLALVRDAIAAVASFTTDDESMDDFCADSAVVAPVSAAATTVAAASAAAAAATVNTTTAGRQPLRTPSLASPQIEPGDVFPWSRALQMTSPLSNKIETVDAESEDLFPSSRNSLQDDWCSKADSQSVNSAVDSGLGLSLGSSHFDQVHSPSASTKPMLIAGSLPARGRSALSSIFGRKKPFESKSWSDMWDEEEEERAALERESQSAAVLSAAAAAATARPARPSRVSTLSQIDSESDGRSTPRAVLSQLSMPNLHASAVAEARADDAISQHTGFVFEEHQATTLKYSPPSKRSLLDKGMDKWSALGERRRGASLVSPSADHPLRDDDDTAAVPRRATPESASKKREFFRPSNWRRNTSKARPTTGYGGPTAALSRTVPHHQIWQQKSWNLSTDWRSTHNLPAQLSHAASRAKLPPPASQLDGGYESFGSDNDNDDDDDDQWVGGWKSIHL